MRLLLISVAASIAAALLLSLPMGISAAGDGHQATITMSYTMDLSGFNAPATKGHQKKGASTPAAPAFDQTMTGVMYWAPARSRVELDMKEAGRMISICDWDKREMYSLDTQAKTARKIDLNRDIPGLNSELGNSMTNGMDWDKTVASMKNVPGATLKEVGTATVNGIQCTVYMYTMDMSKLTQPSAQAGSKGKAQQDAGMSEFIKSLGTSKGKIWASKELNMAIKMDLAMGGMQMNWQLDDIKSWDVDESVFKVPEGYKIITNTPSPAQHPKKSPATTPGKH